MPEGISNFVVPVNYPSNPWIGRGNAFLYESDVGGMICRTFESKRFCYQIGYEVHPEVSQVEESIPSIRTHELAKTLESDALVSYGWTSGVESVCNLFEWSLTEGTDISARRIQFPAMQDWGTEEWPATLEFEGIADDACIEFCNSCGVIPVLKECLGQVQVFFSNVRSVRAELGYFEDEGNEDCGHVVIRLEVQTSQGAVLDEYDRWVDWFIDKLSATDRTLFTLTVSRI